VFLAEDSVLGSKVAVKRAIVLANRLAGRTAPAAA
jgi:hypothetical protein